jgi:GNAT superfamily N-acetyltransferase
VTLSRERALALQQRGLRDWTALLGSSSVGARVVERDGVIAAIVPACSQRSIVNCVAYADTAALATALDDLASVYDEAGIAAWTVWTPEFDREAIETLESEGHKFDGSPRAMSLDLAGFEAIETGDLDWDDDVDPADFGRLNDLAYGLAVETGLAASVSSPAPGLRLYQARVGGEPASVLGTIDHDLDLGFYFVATHPDHRGLGLASRLISVAIEEAKERGIETSSLQGSAMGQPIYRRLGYSDDFAVNLYERRP